MAASRWETLQAIHWVENPRNDQRPGTRGELGPYQFRPTTWRMHTKRPFSDALIRQHADEVAVVHYEWIKAGLLRAGLEPSVYNIALAWNAGVSAVVNRRIPKVSHNYASRVTALAEELEARQLASAR